MSVASTSLLQRACSEFVAASLRAHAHQQCPDVAAAMAGLGQRMTVLPVYTAADALAIASVIASRLPAAPPGDGPPDLDAYLIAKLLRYLERESAARADPAVLAHLPRRVVVSADICAGPLNLIEDIAVALGRLKDELRQADMTDDVDDLAKARRSEVLRHVVLLEDTIARMRPATAREALVSAVLLRQFIADADPEALDMQAMAVGIIDQLERVTRASVADVGLAAYAEPSSAPGPRQPAS